MGLAKKKVIVMDDAAGARKLVAYLLAEAGHEAIACETWDQTLEAVTKHRPDLVLVDVQMPGTAGAPVAYVLHKSFPDVRVVYLSHYPESVLEELTEKTGADGFVQKSGNIDDMMTRICTFLDQPGGEPSRLNASG